MVLKDSCFLNYYYNDKFTKPTVFEGGEEIILVNWLNIKSLKITINKNIPIKLPDNPSASNNRNILCYCELDAEEHFF